MSPKQADFLRGLMWEAKHRGTLKEFPPSAAKCPPYGAVMNTSTFPLGRVGFGTYGWKYNHLPLYAAAEAGADFLDTAPTYGYGRVEKELKYALRQYPRLRVANKIPRNLMSYDNVLRVFERSLKNLGRDSIDLYQIHWPLPEMGGVLRALDRLASERLIRAIGVCNFSAYQLSCVQEQLENKIVSNQIRLNEKDRGALDYLVPFCRRTNVEVIAYSPLGQDGRCSLEWVLQQKVIAIPRSNNPNHARENARLGRRYA